MPSLFLESKQRTYRQIRAASQGASISLFHGCGEYVATFACATAIAAALGGGAVMEENVPHYRIPLEEIQSALTKLSAKHSVALLDVTCGDDGSRFVLVWKVPAVLVQPKPELNLDEY